MGTRLFSVFDEDSDGELTIGEWTRERYEGPDEGRELSREAAEPLMRLIAGDH